MRKPEPSEHPLAKGTPVLAGLHREPAKIVSSDTVSYRAGYVYGVAYDDQPDTFHYIHSSEIRLPDANNDQSPEPRQDRPQV
jgi:hypothetical protein